MQGLGFVRFVRRPKDSQSKLGIRCLQVSRG